VADADCTGERLARELDAVRSDPGRLAEMQEAARSLGHLDAVAAIVDVVDGAAGPGADGPKAGTGHDDGPPVDLSRPRRIHLVGVGGAA